MHGQYNLPESRIFRFSIPANAGAAPLNPPQGALPLEPRWGLKQAPDPRRDRLPPIIYKLPASTKENKNPAMQWDKKELDTQFTPNVCFCTPNSEILAKALSPTRFKKFELMVSAYSISRSCTYSPQWVHYICLSLGHWVGTVEPPYNKDRGTMKLPCYIRHLISW